MKRKVNILVECPGLIASVKVGVLEPLKPLQEQGKCDVVFKETMHIKKRDIAWCDILICVRGYEMMTLNIVKAAKLAERFVIYFLDDDFLSIPSNIQSGQCFQLESTKETLKSTIKQSDILWCVNALIGQKYSGFGNGKWVLNKVPVLNSAKEENGQTDIVNIIYAGSSDHSTLIQEIISPAVEKLCVEYEEKVRFTFIGADPNIKHVKNVEYYKYFENYEEYRSFVEVSDFKIGLAIIGTDEFYKAKYYNKFIEYTSIGCVGIYTNSEPYLHIVKDGINGFLCENVISQWYQTLKKVIDNSELREECKKNAMQLLKTEFEPFSVAQQIENNIPEISTYYAKTISYKVVKLENVLWTLAKNRIKQLWLENKVLFFPSLIKKVIRFAIRQVKGYKIWRK